MRRFTRQCFLSGLFLWTVLFFYHHHVAQASTASLYVTPTSGPYMVGDTIIVYVKVASVDEAMNAVTGRIVFSSSTMRVVATSKDNSIMNLWETEEDPIISNANGIIRFTAIKFNPGYQGPAGLIFTIIFEARAPGTGTVSFASGQVLANDGRGTAIPTTFGGAVFTIVPSTAVPGPPIISSPSHPDSNQWYANKELRLQWTVNSNANGTSFILDQNADTVPDTQSEGNISSYIYANVREGTSYFHARLLNTNGWGPAAHFKVQIDTENPDYFTVVRVHPPDLDSSRAAFSFDAFDHTSGIDYFSFQIDDQYSQPWRSSTSTRGIFRTSPLLPGGHVLKATAFDRAGNFLLQTVLFEIAGGVSLPPPGVSYGGVEYGGAGSGIVSFSSPFITQIINATSTQQIIKTITQFVPQFIPQIVVKTVAVGYEVVNDVNTLIWLALIIILLLIIWRGDHENHRLKEENRRLQRENSYPQP